MIIGISQYGQYATRMGIVSRPFALDSGCHHPPQALLAVMNSLDPPSSPLCIGSWLLHLYSLEGRCAPFASPGPTESSLVVSLQLPLFSHTRKRCLASSLPGLSFHTWRAKKLESHLSEPLSSYPAAVKVIPVFCTIKISLSCLKHVEPCELRGLTEEMVIFVDDFPSDLKGRGHSGHRVSTLGRPWHPHRTLERGSLGKASQASQPLLTLPPP